MELDVSMIIRRNVPQSTLGKWEKLIEKTEIPKFSRCSSTKNTESKNSQRIFNASNDNEV